MAGTLLTEYCAAEPPSTMSTIMRTASRMALGAPVTLTYSQYKW
jgi:hypothetical protein